MSRTGGRHRSSRSRFPVVAVLLHLVSGLAAAALWVVLVAVAIRFGRTAREGDSSDWVVVGLATAGAVVVLLVGLALLARMFVVAGVVSDYRPKRAARRH